MGLIIVVVVIVVVIAVVVVVVVCSVDSCESIPAVIVLVGGGLYLHLWENRLYSTKWILFC
jgi:hypothetical protein